MAPIETENSSTTVQITEGLDQSHQLHSVAL
jgi:hypothetical protein